MGEGVKLYNSRWVKSARPTTPSTSTGGYSAGDLIGTKMTFADVISADQGGGSIVGAIVVDLSKQNSALDLLLFGDDLDSGTGAGTTWATGDDAALDAADSDLATCIGHISIGTGDYSILNDNSIANVSTNLPFYISGKNLYGLVVARGTPTFASTDELEIRLLIERDA